MSWLRIRELVRKEFIQLLSDRRNRAIMFIFPFSVIIHPRINFKIPLRDWGI